MPRAPFGVVLAVAAAAGLVSGPAWTRGPERVDFQRDVQPILRERCYSCHGSSKQQNGFRLDRRRDAMRGGTTVVITPGSAQSSRLYLRLVGTQFGRQMPVEGDMDAAEIDLIRRWIDEGAEWPDAASGELPLVPLDADGVHAFEDLRAGRRQRFLDTVLHHPALSHLRGPGGATPLMAAALYGDAAVIRTLLDAGADPNVADDAGATPLMWAVDDLEKTRLLVEHGADVNAASDAQRRPLLIAAGIQGNRDVLAYLLDHGANPSMKGPGQNEAVTPVSDAAKESDEAMLRLLIERGADGKSIGPQALAFSFRTGCDGCMAALAPFRTAQTETALMLSAAPPRGPALATAALVAAGADVNARTRAGFPILLLAAASDALPVDGVRALLARGADVNVRGPNGETALMLARRNGTTTMTDLLAAAGADEGQAPQPAVASAPAQSPAEAVRRSLPLLQKGDVQFLRTAGCVSCHSNSLTAMTVARARREGFAVDETVAARQRAGIASYVEDWRERNLQGLGVPGDHDTMSEILTGLAAEGHGANIATDAMARFIWRQQRPDGHWPIFAYRPPLESSDIAITATSIRALQSYASPNLAAEINASIARGAKWLRQARPQSAVDRAYRLLGLSWTHADPAAVKSAGADVLRAQRADGGWAQLPTLPSDAYATGQALVSLLETRAVTPRDQAVRRGVAFLLKTQCQDGSWFVQSRAIPLQPYFDAGFPYGRSQFISIAATNWATMALVDSGAAHPARRN